MTDPCHPTGRDRTGRDRELVSLLGLDRLSIFVPAVMSVGLLFWLVNEARDLLRAQRVRARHKRATLAGAALVGRIPGAVAEPADEPAPERLGLRPRPVYVLLAVAFLGGAVYVAVGATGNYLRPGGYLSDIAWLGSLAWGLAVVASCYGAAALVAAVTYPRPARPLLRLLRASPLSVEPIEPGTAPGRASWRVVAGWWSAAGAFGVIALAVGWAPNVLRDFDHRVADWVAGVSWPAIVGWFDPLGRTEVAIGVALIVGVAGLRCRVLALGYGMATATALVLSIAVRPLVGHERPPGGPFAGRVDSFPSGQVMLLTVMAGLLPVAIGVLCGRRGLIGPLRAVLGLGVLGAAADRIAGRNHWPSDVVAGILAGLAVVLAIEWVLDTERAHGGCRRCLWHRRTTDRRRGLVQLELDTAAVVRILAHVAAAAAAIGLAVMTVVADVPNNSDYTPFGAAVQRPVQFGLAGLVSLGALVSWKRPAIGAVMIAFAGAGLGLFASVEYEPVYAVAMTVALLVPSVLLWLSWQHDRTHREITAVATVTAVLLGGTWFGATTVYEGYYGPTHPASTTAAVAADRVEWVWLGGLSADGVRVTARLTAADAAAEVVVRSSAGDERARVGPVPAGEHRIVRFDVTGLAPDERYSLVVVVDGREDGGRGRATFRTPGVGAYSFRLAVASCARNGTNGAVFDAIRAVDPLLFVNDGDLHYRDIASTDPGPFLDAYDRLLTAPAPAALARSVPMGYVWDDHDYGPNDADATAPGRGAARQAYRLAVPHYDIAPGDAPINQAFTIGRVRIVMTDGRSERTATSLLGDAQRRWLIEEITSASRTHAVVLWINPTPWIGAASAGNDTWAGYPEERRVIADAIAAGGVRNLVMVSGDAHMVAIDDGTNSDYSTARVGGFPVLQAAALDRPGNVKGGPYSDGAFPGGGQFGLVGIDDDGGAVTVRLEGRTWDGRSLVVRSVVIG